uniref:Candidate secreted effector n=1 Tax=Meloidogyne incognita TaxID=6306 RepID=A0A914LZP1_MELIC
MPEYLKSISFVCTTRISSSICVPFAPTLVFFPLPGREHFDGDSRDVGMGHPLIFLWLFLLLLSFAP